MDNGVRIRVETPPDEDGYPPSSVEWLWAERLPDGNYKIDSIPIYAKNLSDGDIVSANAIDGALHFGKVVERSGHSTYRVMLQNGASLEDPQVAPFWRPMADLGCSYEGLGNSPLFAIDVPPEADINKVFAHLERGLQENIWDFEEGMYEH
jgi:hypothetical protein